MKRDREQRAKAKQNIFINLMMIKFVCVLSIGPFGQLTYIVHVKNAIKKHLVLFVCSIATSLSLAQLNRNKFCVKEIEAIALKRMMD